MCHALKVIPGFLRHVKYIHTRSYNSEILQSVGCWVKHILSSECLGINKNYYYFFFGHKSLYLRGLKVVAWRTRTTWEGGR